MVTALFLIPASFAQATGGDKVDLDALAQIKTEAFEPSQVMENLFWMTDVYGPRRKGLGSGQEASREGSGSVPPYGGGADEELRQCECATS
jgi:hypothetical protein